MCKKNKFLLDAGILILALVEVHALSDCFLVTTDMGSRLHAIFM